MAVGGRPARTGYRHRRLPGRPNRWQPVPPHGMGRPSLRAHARQCRRPRRGNRHTPPRLVSGFRAAGAAVSEQSLGVELPARIALDKSGRIVVGCPFSQAMTVVETLIRRTEGRVSDRALSRRHDARAHRTGRPTSACVLEADLLIGADGLNSTVRSQFLPELKPYYPGYLKPYLSHLRGDALRT